MRGPFQSCALSALNGSVVRAQTVAYFCDGLGAAVADHENAAPTRRKWLRQVGIGGRPDGLLGSFQASRFVPAVTCSHFAISSARASVTYR
jgi:hypothetical protein